MPGENECQKRTLQLLTVGRAARELERERLSPFLHSDLRLIEQLHGAGGWQCTRVEGTHEGTVPTAAGEL